MAAIHNGAMLTKKLRESGTGGAKLLVCTNLLEEVSQKDGRVASSDEVIAELEKAFPGSVTVQKARQFAATGEYAPFAAPEPRGEERFLPVGERTAVKNEVKPLVGPMSVHEGELEAKRIAEARSKHEAEAKALAEEKQRLDAEKAALAEARSKHEAEAKAKFEADAKAKSEEEAKNPKGPKSGK